MEGPGVHVAVGVPADVRAGAAALFYDTFRRKFAPIARDRDAAVAAIEADMVLNRGWWPWSGGGWWASPG